MVSRIEKVIIENIPAAQFHAGCRLRFGPDGKLYITTGDATDRQLAQQLDSLAGKTLRLNDDGTIPTDTHLLLNRKRDQKSGHTGIVTRRVWISSLIQTSCFKQNMAPADLMGQTVAMNSTLSRKERTMVGQ
jgi:hypothetical protein